MISTQNIMICSKILNKPAIYGCKYCISIPKDGIGIKTEWGNSPTEWEID